MSYVLMIGCCLIAFGVGTPKEGYPPKDPQGMNGPAEPHVCK